MEHWGKTKGGQAYKKRNDKKITGLGKANKRKMRIYNLDEIEERSIGERHADSKITKVRNDLEMDNIRQMIADGKLKQGDITKKGKITMITKVSGAGGHPTVVFERKPDEVTFASGMDLHKEEKQLSSSFQRSSLPKGVRKNAKFGKGTWYLNDWKVGDRTVEQFGLLLSSRNGRDRAWITEKEANHIRISKEEAHAKLSE